MQLSVLYVIDGNLSVEGIVHQLVNNNILNLLNGNTFLIQVLDILRNFLLQFLDLLKTDEPFFSLKLVYDGDKLVEVQKNGRDMKWKK